MAWFGWESPLFDGRHRAFHCLDICFWFLNTDRMVTHTGGGKAPRDLSYRMADALLAFMRTGDPNCPSLPSWPRYTPRKGEVMILDDRCRTAGRSRSGGPTGPSGIDRQSRTPINPTES